MRRALLLLLWVATSVAADEIRFGDERVIAAPQTNFPEDVAAGIFVTVTPGDGQFLVTWADYRGDNPTSTSPYRTSYALAVRVDGSGRALDAHPIALPFQPYGAVWTGNEWIVLSTVALRISREGRLVGGIVPLWDSRALPRQDQVAPAVWTGSALLVTSTDHVARRLLVRTFDAELQLIEEHSLLTHHQGGTVLGAVTDGTTALVAYRGEFFSLEPTRAAVFSRDGHLLRGFTFPQGPQYHSVAGFPGGYAILGSELTGGERGYIVDAEGTTKTIIDAFVVTSASSARRHLLWDGASLLLLQHGWDEKLVSRFTFVRISTQGKVLQQQTELKKWDYGATPPRATVAIMGRTLAMAGPVFSYGVRVSSLDVRVAPDVTSLFTVPPTAVPPGAQPRETPAAATSASQILVAWRQRTAVSGPLDVYATRLDPNANPVDANAIAVGTGSCPAVPPAVASDGRDFFVAWSSEGSVFGSVVRADGTRGAGLRLGRYGTCTEGSVSIASNGAQYLVVWATPDLTNYLRIYGVRVAADGTLLDKAPLQIGMSATPAAKTTVVKVAANGTDYLVVWESSAVRINAATGKVLDTTPLPLGGGSADAVWFNGRTYVAAVFEPAGYRFFRIGADGSGAATWNTPPQPLHRVAWSGGRRTLAPACVAGSCFAWWEGRVLRIEDKGESFVVTSDTSNLDRTVMKDPLLVPGARLLAVYSRREAAAPYSHASDIFVRATGSGKRRAARQ